MLGQLDMDHNFITSYKTILWNVKERGEISLILDKASPIFATVEELCMGY